MKIKWYISDLIACGHVRAEVIAREVNAGSGEHEIDCKSNISLSDFYRTDVMIFQRQHHQDIAVKMEHARKNGILVVYDLDDDLFNISPEFKAPYEFYSKPSILNAMQACMSQAHAVTVSTRFLADSIAHRTRGQPKFIVDNCVDTGYWQSSDAYKGREARVAEMKNLEDPLTIGWMASGSHIADAPEVAGPLAKIMEEFPSVRLKLIGWVDWESFKDMELEVFKDRIECLEWVEVSELPESMVDFDIGIAPLKNNLFNRSKSNIKFSQHSALGIPTVAANLEPYECIRHEDTGMLCVTGSDWYNSLKLLIENKQQRIDMGKRAMAQTKEMYDVKVMSGIWLNTLSQLRGTLNADNLVHK